MSLTPFRSERRGHRQNRERTIPSPVYPAPACAFIPEECDSCRSGTTEFGAMKRYCSVIR